MPSQIPPPLPRQSRLAWASLLLGILANVFLPVVASIPGIICGHLALRAMRQDPTLLGKKSAKTGLVLGYLSIAAVIFLWATWLLLAPMVTEMLPTIRELYNSTSGF